MMEQNGAMIYEGKAKILYGTSHPDQLVQYFKDDATAFNGAKKGQIRHKGILNNYIASYLFSLLEEEEGIPTHFLARSSDREMRVRRVEIIPLEIVVRNVVAGSLARRLGIDEGASFDGPILELYYKRDDLNDPLINDDHVRAFRLAQDDELLLIRAMAMRVNAFLQRLFGEKGILLVDFKLEFGRTPGGLVLADEISPDGCRLWDMQSGEKLDKDRFRRDLGQVESAYWTILSRICGVGVADTLASKLGVVPTYIEPSKD